MVVNETASPEAILRRRLTSISNLPTPPMVFTQISKVINDPATSTGQIASIMSEDPAMSAKVLRLSNSAYYGARSEITHIKQAVIVLGLDAIKSLVLSSSVFDMFKDKKLDAAYQENFWRHSLSTAMATRLVIAQFKELWGLDGEVGFSAGLLHDIGKLIICCYMPEEHRNVIEHVREHDCSDYQSEEELLGFTHPLAGQILAENWRLPKPILRAIGTHHTPAADGEEGDRYAVGVHVANFLAIKTFEAAKLRLSNWSYLDSEIRDRLELDEELIDSLCSQLLDEYSRSSTFMQMAVAG